MWIVLEVNRMRDESGVSGVSGMAGMAGWREETKSFTVTDLPGVVQPRSYVFK